MKKLYGMIVFLALLLGCVVWMKAAIEEAMQGASEGPRIGKAQEKQEVTIELQ